MSTKMENKQKGQAIGSTAGAIAGSIIAPGVGTAVGSQLGGVLGGGVGGMFGSSGNDSLKYMPTEPPEVRASRVAYLNDLVRRNAGQPGLRVEADIARIRDMLARNANNMQVGVENAQRAGSIGGNVENIVEQIQERAQQKGVSSATDLYGAEYDAIKNAAATASRRSGYGREPYGPQSQPQQGAGGSIASLLPYLEGMFSKTPELPSPSNPNLTNYGATNVGSSAASAPLSSAVSLSSVPRAGQPTSSALPSGLFGSLNIPPLGAK